MARKFRRWSLVLVLASTGGLLFSSAAQARPAHRPLTADEAAASVRVTSKAPAGAVARYWTDERKRAATPEPGLTVTAADLDRARPTLSRFKPQSGVGSLPRGAVEAVDVPVGPLAGKRAELWNRHGSMPAVTIGTLFYVRDNGSNGYCTASVITAGNASTIWTAGHCVHGGKGRTWFDRFFFEPDHHDSQAPLGAWEWKSVVTTRGWMDDGDWAYDIAAVALFPNSRGLVAHVTGSQGYKFGHGHNWNVHFFGYPEFGVPDRDEFNGERLFFCTGPTRKKNLFDGRMISDCDMHHGSSGGPWLDDLQLGRGWGYIVGAYSSRDSSFDNSEVRSAYHGDAAINVYNEAQDE